MIIVVVGVTARNDTTEPVSCVDGDIATLFEDGGLYSKSIKRSKDIVNQNNESVDASPMPGFT